jgi:purine-binding chemotaxis protein CheW
MSNLPAVTGEANKSSHEVIQLVSFALEGEEYGVEVLKVREIIRMTSITHMPNTSGYVDGIINLRGKVIPIISLRRKFGMAETENNNRTRIIVMDVGGELTGFVVDSVSEVLRVTGSEIQPPPPVVSGAIDQECLAGVINRPDRLLVMLDLERIFSNDEKQLLSALG